MSLDYSPQLEEIVKALNRPSIPTWLIAIMSASLGFLASVLSQIFQHCYSEHRARSKMRMIIYPEIGGMYSDLVHFHNYDLEPSKLEDMQMMPNELTEWKKGQLLERCLKFEGEKYADDNKHVFIQLKERSTIIEIYSAIREVVDPKDELPFVINSGLAIEIIEDFVRLNDLPRKFVRRYMNGSDVEAIAEANRKRLALGQAGPTSISLALHRLKRLHLGREVPPEKESE
jgi:hypothetical protein